MDELVKQLWECASGECFNCSQYTETTNASVCSKELMKQAAEAIEELGKYANAIRKLKCEGWYLQQTKYHDGYQAVSTMPLPEPPKEET